MILGHVGRRVDSVVIDDVEELLEGLDDEDQSDQQRKALLREARDVLNLSSQQIASSVSDVTLFRLIISPWGVLTIMHGKCGCDVTNQSAKIERHHDEQNSRHPHSDPEAEAQVVPVIRSETLSHIVTQCRVCVCDPTNIVPHDNVGNQARTACHSTSVLRCVTQYM